MYFCFVCVLHKEMYIQYEYVLHIQWWRFCQCAHSSCLLIYRKSWVFPEEAVCKYPGILYSKTKTNKHIHTHKKGLDPEQSKMSKMFPGRMSALQWDDQYISTLSCDNVRLHWLIWMTTSVKIRIYPCFYYFNNWTNRLKNVFQGFKQLPYRQTTYVPKTKYIISIVQYNNKPTTFQVYNKNIWINK